MGLRVIRLLQAFALLAILLLAAILIFNSYWFQKKFLYPFPYQAMITKYAYRYGLDPLLVAAVVRTESNFRPTARSAKGAVGLMQIMPETGAWAARQMKLPFFEPNLLEDPETNIHIGIWYMASLRDEFAGNPVLILAAYNGGRGSVRQWMQKFRWDNQFTDIGEIPYRETREYVIKVLYDYKQYQKLYGR